MPFYPLILLLAARKSFFLFLLKMPDQDCCSNVRSIWPKAYSKRHWVNWRRKKNRGRNKEVKKTILILFKKALKIHLLEFEPRLCYSIPTWVDTCHSPLTSGPALLFRLLSHFPFFTLPQTLNSPESRPGTGWMGCPGHFVRLLSRAFSRTAYAKYSV